VIFHEVGRGHCDDGHGAYRAGRYRAGGDPSARFLGGFVSLAF
jgi:hypothetical protein